MKWLLGLGIDMIDMCWEWLEWLYCCNELGGKILLGEGVDKGCIGVFWGEDIVWFVCLLLFERDLFVFFFE